MAFVLTPEQESIRDTARRFFRERTPVAHLRHLRDTADATGFSREIWREMAELGFAGITLPAEHGGAGLGLADLGIVLEECGRNLVPSPLMSTVLLGAGAVALAGSAAQKDGVLPAVAAGERILALAHEEGTRHARYRVRTTAARTAGGFRISGEKVLVLDGHVADAFVVVARTSGRASGDADRDGLTLFLVPASSPGVSAARTLLIDSRGAARVQLDGVAVTQADVLGAIDHGADVLDPVLDQATVGLSAEMLGSLVETFERTVAYLEERRQFGVPIGSFQALKHRAALMFCEIELARSVVMDALRALDEARPDAPLCASAAKARATDVFLLVTAEAVQMHGGVGVTDELDIGLFLKRARSCEATFGGAAYHRDRFARLSRY
jgi:alkylation response protein AidB-like acyl-CoA dehydrogenase